MDKKTVALTKGRREIYFYLMIVNRRKGGDTCLAFSMNRSERYKNSRFPFRGCESFIHSLFDEPIPSNRSENISSWVARLNVHH
jgi:hypothetical protein